MMPKTLKDYYEMHCKAQPVFKSSAYADTVMFLLTLRGMDVDLNKLVDDLQKATPTAEE
jgi:hypothetical protein